MRKITYITLIIILLIGVVLVYGINETRKLSEYFNEKSESAIIDQVQSQKEINRELATISNDEKYTIDKPYIKLNPYSISPLSAIIIFKTEENVDIDVYINGEYFTKMESSKKHVIPIYGLYDDYDNVITLKASDKEYSYNIKTLKSNMEYPLEILENKSVVNKNDIIFTVASYKTYLTGWDKEGKLRFYLTVDNRMDVEWLDNGHFIIGTSEGQFRENFVGLVEMDYLGKIYNYYNLEHGNGFELQVLDNGNYMTAGGEEAIYFNHQYIYEMNPKDGSVVSYLDIYDVIKGIDESFPDEYLGPKAIRNGFYYDENTDTLVVSFREINTIFNFNYKEKKLNHVFTSEDNDLFSSSAWDKYRVKVNKGRYPMGQHTPTITKEGYLAFFNNDYDRYGIAFKNKSNNVGSYKDNYTSVEIYNINDNVANLVWNYDFNKKYFSIKYGLFNVLENNHKFIDLGYILKDDFRKKDDNSLVEVEKDVKDIYSLIIELDENDNVIFKAKSEEGKYRAFNHDLYNKETKNVSVKELNIIDTVKKDKISETSIKKLNVSESMEWINTFEFTKHTFTTDYKIKENDEVKLYFLNSKGKIFTFTYKNKDNNKINRVFNVDLKSGNYRVYISINDNLYDTKKVYSF